MVKSTEKIKKVFRPALIARVGLLLLVQTALAEPPPWPAAYMSGSRTITFSDAAQFTYKGKYCFPGDSDAGIQDEFSGTYRFDGHWITLEPQGQPWFKGCSIDTRLYLAAVDGHTVLVEESHVQQLVNEMRSGQPGQEIYPWHRPGEPDRFRVDPSTWFPATYAELYKIPAAQGKVIAVEERREWKRYGAAGRDDGMSASALVTTDIGTRLGAFAGMTVCHPDMPTDRFTVTAVTPEASILRWTWSVGTTRPTPAVGMAVTNHCPHAPYTAIHQ